MIIVLSVVVGITDALSMPSFQSIVPSIVTHDEIGRGLALNSTQFNLSRILGPSIAGVLMSSFGAIACFVRQRGVLRARSSASRLDPPAPDSGGRRQGTAPHPLRRIGDIVGARSAARRAAHRSATSVLCAPLVTFSPVLVKDVFHGDAGRFSLAVARSASEAFSARRACSASPPASTGGD